MYLQSRAVQLYDAQFASSLQNVDASTEQHSWRLSASQHFGSQYGYRSYGLRFHAVFLSQCTWNVWYYPETGTFTSPVLSIAPYIMIFKLFYVNFGASRNKIKPFHICCTNERNVDETVWLEFYCDVPYTEIQVVLFTAQPWNKFMGWPDFTEGLSELAAWMRSENEIKTPANSFILSSILQQVHSPFQSEFFTQWDLLLPLSVYSILSFL